VVTPSFILYEEEKGAGFCCLTFDEKITVAKT